MRLTTLTDYALRVLIYAGTHNERLCTISEIANAYDISQTHLMKVSQLLAQQGWISTLRGKNGGLRLSKAPQDIRLGTVVQSIEPDFAVVECLGSSNSCKLSGNCALSCIMRGALHAFLQHLNCYTLADVMQQFAHTRILQQDTWKLPTPLALLPNPAIPLLSVDP